MAAAIVNDDFWDDLLDKVAEGKVIPVIGQAAVTCAPDNTPLYPWLAGRLAEKLELSVAPPPATVRLDEVVSAYLATGGARNTLCTRLARLLRNEAPKPGATLRSLAQIAHFRLFVTTAIDSLLEKALQDARYGGAARTQTLAFFPGAPVDLPQPLAELSSATVYHLLGRVSTTPGEYVVGEDDLLDFICELQRHIGTDPMRRLAVELKSRSLLLLGLNFADWPVRLLMRVASQDSLARVTQLSLVAEGPPRPDTRSMVLFFGGVNKNISVIECEPREFADELARRWLLRFPQAATSLDAVRIATPPEPTMRPGAIFISYAREDEEAVRRLKTGLEHYGCDVWYDRERLKTGMDFNLELQSEITQECSVFISLISKTTENPVGENYFMRERNWASSHAFGLSEAQRPEFYVPVLIDAELPSRLMHEPGIFSNIHWNHLPGGVVTEAFGRQLAALQKKYRTAGDSAPPEIRAAAA